MSSHKITHYIEIPIEIEFEFQPEEMPTLTYPGAKMSVTIESATLPNGQTFDQYIENLIKKSDGLEMACWEHLQALEEGRE